VTIVDAKQRTWRVFDATDAGEFRTVLPFGSPRALVRFFWRDDHVRMRRVRDDKDRATELTRVRKQLRSTYRVDFPEQYVRSSGEAIQDLYDARLCKRTRMDESR
jgi:hypothetical protein